LMIPAIGSREILQERCGKVTGSFRKTPEIAGTWKQYSEQKLSEFFSRGFLSTSCPFRPEYCFHKMTGITRNRPFPGGTVRPGSTIRRQTWVFQDFVFEF
jgi:hypothetical protein